MTNPPPIRERGQLEDQAVIPYVANILDKINVPSWSRGQGRFRDYLKTIERFHAAGTFQKRDASSYVYASHQLHLLSTILRVYSTGADTTLWRSKLKSSLAGSFFEPPTRRNKSLPWNTMTELSVYAAFFIAGWHPELGGADVNVVSPWGERLTVAVKRLRAKQQADKRLTEARRQIRDACESGTVDKGMVFLDVEEEGNDVGHIRHPVRVGSALHAHHQAEHVAKSYNDYALRNLAMHSDDSVVGVITNSKLFVIVAGRALTAGPYQAQVTGSVLGRLSRSQADSIVREADFRAFCRESEIVNHKGS
ncbi:MAG: hypothetical protein AAFO89_00600 [Planctomycetota bacterium]